MNLKTVKLLIYSLLGILCVFLGLIFVGREDARKPVTAFSASALAERSLAEARASADTKKNAAVFYSTGLPAGSLIAEGAIMMVKDKEFQGVAEEPKSMMDMLTGMAGNNKKKNPPVYLTDKDLDAKILVEKTGKSNDLVNSSAVPEPGSGVSAGNKAMISAPVDYKIFRDSETWQAFASTHKGHFPRVEFPGEEMLVLISVSELPSGIFKIEGLKRSAKETVVLYRVDPLAMAVDNDKSEQNFYSAAAIPKNIDVKLEQIP